MDLRYKTKLCKNYSSGFCSYGERCNFAHGYSEMRSMSNFNFPNFNLNGNLDGLLELSESPKSSEDPNDAKFIPVTTDGRKRLHFLKKKRQEKRISKKDKNNYIRSELNFREMLNMMKYGDDNYQIMRETGICPEDLALNMMGWDKEDRDYAFIDRYCNGYGSDGSNSDDY